MSVLPWGYSKPGPLSFVFMLQLFPLTTKMTWAVLPNSVCVMSFLQSILVLRASCPPHPKKTETSLRVNTKKNRKPKYNLVQTL